MFVVSFVWKSERWRIHTLPSLNYTHNHSFRDTISPGIRQVNICIPELPFFVCRLYYMHNNNNSLLHNLHRLYYKDIHAYLYIYMFLCRLQYDT